MERVRNVRISVLCQNVSNLKIVFNCWKKRKKVFCVLRARVLSVFCFFFFPFSLSLLFSLFSNNICAVFLSLCSSVPWHKQGRKLLYKPTEGRMFPPLCSCWLNVQCRRNMKKHVWLYTKDWQTIFLVKFLHTVFIIAIQHSLQ